MKVVSVLGGLGSSMFKYAFYLSLKEGEIDNGQFMIDTSFFVAKNCPEMYELKSVFGIDDPDYLDLFNEEELKILKSNPKSYPSVAIEKMRSTYGDLDYYFMGKHYFFKKGKKSSPLSYKFRKLLYIENRFGIRHTYDVNSFKDNKNYYFDEYAHNSDVHFPKDKELLKKVFTFPDFNDQKNIDAKKDMENSESVAIHVRRTDHLGDNKVLYKREFYKKAVSYIKEHALQKQKFYIFSDDVEWCKNNKDVLGLSEEDDVNFVDWNKGVNGYKDMQLMTYCQHNVVPLSSFSWWGYYLSNRTDKIVIAPKKIWDDIKIHF